MKRLKTLALPTALLALLTAVPIAAHEGGTHVMGTIKNVAEKSLTILTRDKKEVVVVLDEKTKFQKGGEPATVKDLKAGARVVVDVEKGQTKETHMAKEVKIGSADVIYTCPMHPEVQSKETGKCPKCGMNLEPKA
ncbi:MAG TPA: heavy metal-binding domain-containing protein [Thermoanaerobaculia bacterium]|jgi:ABC-type branched-subunit amino acid transport system substrate-binding protein